MLIRALALHAHTCTSITKCSRMPVHRRFLTCFAPTCQRALTGSAQRFVPNGSASTIAHKPAQGGLAGLALPHHQYHGSVGEGGLQGHHDMAVKEHGGSGHFVVDYSPPGGLISTEVGRGRAAACCSAACCSSPAEERFIELKLALAAGVRRLRERHGLTCPFGGSA